MKNQHTHTHTNGMELEEKRLLSEHSFAYITKIVYAKHNISLTQNTLKQRTKTKTI